MYISFEHILIVHNFTGTKEVPPLFQSTFVLKRRKLQSCVKKEGGGGSYNWDFMVLYYINIIFSIKMV